MDTAAPQFRTKTGTCTVYPDRLELVRSGVRGALARALFGQSMARVRLVYVLGGGLLLVYGVRLLIGGNPIPGVLFSGFGALLLWNVVASRSLSAAPVLSRAAITRMEAHAPRPPATRGYFIVHSTDGGRSRRRFVMLPGSLDGGAAEYERALLLLQNAGYPVVTP